MSERKIRVVTLSEEDYKDIADVVREYKFNTQKSSEIHSKLQSVVKSKNGLENAWFDIDGSAKKYC